MAYPDAVLFLHNYRYDTTGDRISLDILLLNYSHLVTGINVLPK